MLLGGDALGRPVVGQISNPAADQVPIGWLRSLSDPVRTKRGLTAPRHPAFAYGSYQPVVSFGWMEALSEPVRVKIGLSAREQQFLALQPTPSPFVASGWFEWLSDPVRKKPRSPAALSPFDFFQPAPSPFVASGWYANLSDPVRIKPGLKAALQQAYVGPSRVLPTPALTGILDALETKDVFLAGAMIFNRPSNTEIGVINTTPQPAEIAVYPAAPTPGTITVRISIVIS